MRLVEAKPAINRSKPVTDSGVGTFCLVALLCHQVLYVPRLRPGLDAIVRK
jgi:hypothetical protein